MKSQEERGLRHIKHLPQTPCTGKYFQITTFALAFYQSNLLRLDSSKNKNNYLEPGNWKVCSFYFSMAIPAVLGIIIQLEE